MRNYKSAFRAYVQYTGMTATELIDEAIEDHKRDPREKKDIVLKRLIGFYWWLKNEYKVKRRGRGEHNVVKTGVSDKLAHQRVAAIRSFYATFGITVRMKGRHALPEPRVENKRTIVNAELVRMLMDNARPPRDRTAIITMFQGGLDVSTLCSLVYGDVKHGLERNEHPLKLEPQRVKTGVENYTFLGKDAVKALKIYIKDMERRGVKFTDDSPLFRKERGKYEAAEPKHIQDMLRDVAVRSWAS
ncbi:MAG: hypothetical protein ACE5NN_03445 [Candidatus Bathyarchaeia archaeon]